MENRYPRETMREGRFILRSSGCCGWITIRCLCGWGTGGFAWGAAWVELGSNLDGWMEEEGESGREMEGER